MEFLDLITIRRESCPEDRIVIEVADCVFPYIRQTRTSRFRKDDIGERVRAYNDQQARLRDVVRMALKRLGVVAVPFFGGKPKVGFSSSFRTPKANVCDLGNLEKAAEDLCNTVIYHDDKQITRRGVGEKEYSKNPSMRIEVWRVIDA